MRVGVIGAGAVGLFFASAYRQVGADVTLFTRRPSQARNLNDKGVTVSGLLSQTAQVTAYTMNEVVSLAFDLLIVAVKSYDVTEALRTFLPANHHVRQWLFVQNGMTHLETLMLLQQDVYVASIEYGLKKNADTEVEVTGIGQVCVAPFRVSANGSFLEIPVFVLRKEDDYQQMLENKLIVNSCVNPLTALLSVNNGALLENRGYKQAMRAVFLEAIGVLERQADWRMLWRRVVSVCQKTRANTSSMRADYEAGRPLEVGAILGYLLKEAARKKRSAQRIELLYNLLEDPPLQKSRVTGKNEI